jgi:lipopolysaccharide transport system ATP-binding protein
MYVRLAFAVAAHLEPEILIVDEVLAVGDATFQNKCIGKMEGVSKEGRTVLFVSHNMAAVEHLCNKVFVLQSGKLAFSGDPKDGIERYLVGFGSESRSPSSHVVDLSLAPGRPRQLPLLLKRLELFAGNGAPLNGNMKIGGSLKARVSFRLEKPSARFDIILGIDNHLGQRVFTASSEFQPARSEQVRRDDQVMICEILSLLLVPGEYRIKVVLNLNGYAADWVENAARIKVIESDYYKSGKIPKTGMVVLDQRWHLES